MNLFKDQRPETICVGGPKDEKHAFCFVFFSPTLLCMIYASKSRHGFVSQRGIALRTLAFLPPTCEEKKKSFAELLQQSHRQTSNTPLNTSTRSTYKSGRASVYVYARSDVT